MNLAFPPLIALQFYPIEITHQSGRQFFIKKIFGQGSPLKVLSFDLSN
jgi:hypothetical protein